MAKTINDLSPAEKVCLAGYLLTDDIETAYKISRRGYDPKEPEAKNLRRVALRWLREDGCQQYLNFLKGINTGGNDEESDAERKTYREKEDVVREMEQLIPTLTGTDRLQALMKLADLQNMKKDDIVVQEERVHYYLPLSSHLNYCKNCIHKNRMEELNPDLKFTNKNPGDETGMKE